MGKQHVIVIKQDQFCPNVLRIQPGDRVAWENQDGHDHAVVNISGQFRLDTGPIKAGTTSAPVLFPYPLRYSGIEFACRHRGTSEGRLYVSSPLAGARVKAAPVDGAVAAGPTYSPDTWRQIARLVVAEWVYDMADNFGYGKRIHQGAALEQLIAAWSAIESYWQKQTGTTKTILDPNGNIEPTAFASESREKLEALGRRIRMIRRQLRPNVIVPQYPFPDRPDAVASFGELYPGQSDDPFGHAITVNFIPADLQQAEVRHEDYAGALWSAESTLDAGEQLSDAQKANYQTTRAVLLIEDFHALAAHQYFGLSKLFNSGDFQEAKFIDGARRMTVRGEWDGSWFPMWHWLRWIDGYLTVKETGQMPNPLGKEKVSGFG